MESSTFGYATIHLKHDKHKRILGGHLWAFAGEIVEDLKPFTPGDPVVLCESRGGLLGRGYVNPRSLIAVRLLTRGGEVWDDELYIRRIRSAYDYRQAVIPGAEAYRLIYSESDGMPGLIVDRYSDYLIVQSQTAGIERRLEEITAALVEVMKPVGILLKGNGHFRELEGLPEENRVLYGTVLDEIKFRDCGIPFIVSPLDGQKTGFFLDQRSNRAMLGQFADSAKVLDLFSYTGAWGLTALQYGAASATMVDSSARACEWGRKIAYDADLKAKFINSDVSDFVADSIKKEIKYDIVVLDPPALIKSRASEAAGTSMYKALNSQAMKLISAGGYLFSCSCSHLLGRTEHLALIGEAAVRAHRRVRIVAQGGHSHDHPILPGHPETEYLTCFVVQCE